ncbi:coiled-coil domain-containing protein 180-like [Branchiostoma lanceolatum]|uniref:coiled-coil domain-containing protein 180-like n=1 Tax=Branchiostoma lanceolatum TaxID=7740 RepID=UPI003454917F
MAETQAAPPVRVAPSGKVYRQIFDAEVQLVKSYDKVKEKPRASPTSGLLPLVHEGRATTGTGILTARQKTWIEGMPNDSTIENPVLYRKAVNLVSDRSKEPESLTAAREVRGLEDIVVAEKTGSDIIERIAESRRQRHESALEDMHQELGVISTDTEPKIANLGETLMGYLEENDQEIDQLLSRISDDSMLIDYSLPQLRELWVMVASQSSIRREKIHELDSELQKVEDSRMDQISEVLKSYAKTLEQIAHMMAPDVTRRMEKEAMEINQSVLANKRAYADLFARLMTADVEREKKQHLQWLDRVGDWRELNTKRTIEQFREFMHSAPVVQPPGADQVLEHLLTEQKAQAQKRMDLLNSIKDMKPPSSTKTSMYEWYNALSTVNEQIDQLHVQYMGKLHGEYEKVCQECLTEIEKYRELLITKGICGQERSLQVINEHFLPLVGERQRAFEDKLEAMDKALEELSEESANQLKSLFKFAQGGAHIWDVHEIGLAKQERVLQEKLEACRHSHDASNQDREANLDIVMDHMRQDSTEEALQNSLQQALTMLNIIKEGYELFHGQQVNIVKGYPSMVTDELTNYDAALCRFFGVDRNPTGPSKTTTKSPRKKKGDTTARSVSSMSTSSFVSTKVSSTSPLPAVIHEVLTTKKGTSFYVLTEAGEHGIPPEADSTSEPVFLTESETKEDLPAYIENVKLFKSLFVALKKHMRMEFLNHLEEWTGQAVERAKSVVAAKCEELNSELDLRLHLHSPRAKRIEMDVHNVRAAELVMHQERVSRHCKGITTALNELKSRFTDLNTEHNRMFEQFREHIENMEHIFINATKSAKLVSLTNSLQTELEKFMDTIRVSLRQFRGFLDDTLATLRESNARFRMSFKLFSDGGNFSPEEIEEYRKKLERMANKIDSAEGFVMADLEGMEARRLEQATEVVNKFEDRFKNHLMDLIFIEKVTRWFTNTQVKIKSEVQESNTQSQTLHNHLNRLERRIDAVAKPNPDKEQLTPQQLVDYMAEVMETVHDRSQYLNCLKESAPPPEPAPAPAPAPTGRVGFVDGALVQPGKGGKQVAEDASIGVIKNILKTQKVQAEGADVDAEDDKTAAARAVFGDERQRTGLRSVATSRPPTSSSIATSLKKSGRATLTRGDTTLSMVSAGGGTQQVKRLSGRRGSKSKIEKRVTVFGEGPYELTHFLGLVRKILSDALEGLFTIGEVYYKQKGNRTPTRPENIQSNMDDFADIVVGKLQSYQQQADEYHNACLQEFRQQLTRLEELVADVPSLVVTELLQTHLQTAAASRENIQADFSQRVKGWDTEKQTHENDLRPTLGHPQKAGELKTLCDREDARNLEQLRGIQDNDQALQDCVSQHAQSFVADLSQTGEKLLLLYDNLLTIDDVQTGRIDIEKFPTTTLIRKKQAGVDLNDHEYRPTLPRGSNTWPGIPADDMVLQKPPEIKPVTKSGRKTATEKKSKTNQVQKPKTTAAVSTAKTTLGHSSTVEARNKAYQDYLNKFKLSLSSIADQKDAQLTSETRWTDNWSTSVQKVKDLY